MEDAYGVAVQDIFQQVRESLIAADLPFRIDETAFLSILQFAKFRLWKDLDDHWGRFLANPLVKHLTESRTEYFEDRPSQDRLATSLDDLGAMCPVPADASQLEAIKSAVEGKTFVLEGPPGTGKSQTITNLLARAIAEGRKVLFVAEKRAALDVVQSRLAAIGLDPFCLDMHDKGSKPAAVRRQLLDSLTYEPSRDPAGVEAAQGQDREPAPRFSRATETASTRPMRSDTASTPPMNASWRCVRTTRTSSLWGYSGRGRGSDRRGVAVDSSASA